MDLRFPLGEVQRPHPTGPNDLPDDLISHQFDDIMRRRSAFAPPAGMAADPYLIPAGLWRNVQRNAITREGQMLATLADGRDLSFNINVEANRQRVLDELRTQGQQRDEWRARLERSQRADFEFRAQIMDAVIDQKITEMHQESKYGSGMLVIGMDQQQRDDPGWLERTISLPSPVSSIRGALSVIDPRTPPTVTAMDRIQRAGEIQQSRTIGHDMIAAAALLQPMAEMAGRTFDGHGFIKGLVTNLTASIEYAQGRHNDWSDAQASVNRRWDEELWPNLPRPAQILVEEMSPANLAVVIAGGGLSRLLLNSKSPAAHVLGRFLEPLSKGPLAFPREVAAVSAGRIGWEYTDGAPLPVRVAAGGTGLVFGGRPDAVLSPITRNLQRELRQWALREAAPEAFQFGRQPGEDLIRSTTVVMPRSSAFDAASAVAARTDEEQRVRAAAEVLVSRELRALDERLADLTRRYDLITDKNSPEAEELLRRIGRLEAQSDQIGADPEGFLSFHNAFVRAQQELFPDRDPVPDSEFLLRGLRRFHEPPVSGGAPGTISSGDPLFPEMQRPRLPRGKQDVPDVIPVEIPDTARNLTNPRAGDEVMGAVRPALENPVDRAADLAGQQGVTVPPGVARALDTARNVYQGPNDLWRRIADLPGLRTLIGDPTFGLRPSARVPRWMLQSMAARFDTQAELAARIFPSRMTFITQGRQLFGDLTRPSVEYIGPRTRTLKGVAVPAEQFVTDRGTLITGTMADVYQNPHYYALTPSQRNWIQRFDFRNSKVSGTVEDEFGVSIGEFGVPRDTPISERRSGFLPHINADDVRTLRNIESDESQLALVGRFMDRRHATIAARLADPVDGAGFEPVLDLHFLFTALDSTKVSAAGREVLRHGIGGHMARPTAEMIRLYGPFTEIPSLGIWLPADDAKVLGGLLGATEGGLGRLFDTMTEFGQTQLNGDFSLLTIQGWLQWLTQPVSTSRAIIGGIRRGGVDHDALRGFRSQALADDIASDPQGWLDYARFAGIDVSAATPREFQTGLLRHLRLPKGVDADGLRFTDRSFEDINTGLMVALLRGNKRSFTELSAMLIREGTDPEAAKAAAGDVVRMIIPRHRPELSGVSPSRAKAERAFANSVAFIRRPIEHTNAAFSGLVKLGLTPLRLAGDAAGVEARWLRLTPQERLAVQTMATLQGSIAGLSVMSAIVSADNRNLDIDEAVMRALDPNGGDFYRFWIPGTDHSIPLGGPYRSLFRAFRAGMEGDAAGLLNFAKGKTRGIATLPFDLVADRDFFGAQIRQGDWQEQIIRTFGFAAEQIIPIAAGQAIAAERRGLSFNEGLVDTIGEFFGQSPGDISTWERTEIARREGFRRIFRGEEPSTVDSLVQAGLTEVQAQAALDARSTQELREAIGTRAANAFMEGQADSFPDSLAEYEADLERRAARGDRTAQALLLSVRTQRRLDALAIDVTNADGVVDRAAYRARRAGIMREELGASREFQDVFRTFRDSDIEIDRLSAEWFGLYEAATRRSEDGTPIDIDFALFDELEQELFNRIGPEKAALVEANVVSIPRGAGAIERELREVRRELEVSGYFDIRQTVFEQHRGMLEAGDQFNSYIEWVQTQVDARAQFWIGRDMDPAVAIQRAKAEVGDTTMVAAFEALVEVARIEWIQEHAESGLPGRAIEWGYLGAGLTNIVLADELGQSGPTDPDAPATPREDPNSPPATPREDPNSPPATPREESRALDPQTEEMVRLFSDEGLSYGQIAIRLDVPRQTVINRLRRAVGGSPTAALRA